VIRTEIELAQGFVRAHGADLRYSDGRWYRYDGLRWAPDQLETMRERVQASVMAEVVAAAQANDSPMLKFAVSEATARGARSILDLARSHPSIATAPTAWDPDPYLLNIRSGTLDLRTGSLDQHDRKHLITKLADVAFDANATRPKFDAFLAEILPDPEVRGYVQRWVGYCCSGVIREHTLPIFFGAGANGKSTLFELIAALLGDYSAAMPDGFLAEKRNESHPTEIARLRGVRLALSTETRDGCALDEAKVKRLCGGDRLTGRVMRGDFFDFDPSAKFGLMTNHRPKLRGTDEGLRRRVNLIPFTVTVPPERRNPMLREEILATESSGVLNWILQGCAEWYQRGERLEPPEAVKVATADYHTSEDTFARFLAEACELRDPAERPIRVQVKPTELFRAYAEWLADNGEKLTGTQRSVAERLASMGYVSVKGAKGARFYIGVGLVGGAGGGPPVSAPTRAYEIQPSSAPPAPPGDLFPC
jgi:putative DNA primase/helicase